MAEKSVREELLEAAEFAEARGKLDLFIPAYTMYRTIYGVRKSVDLAMADLNMQYERKEPIVWN